MPDANSGAISQLQSEINQVRSHVNSVESVVHQLESHVHRLDGRVDTISKRLTTLEETVRELIHSLERQIDSLISETRTLQLVVERQGQGIQERVLDNTQKVESGTEIVSGTVRAGFTDMSRQEIEARLGESRAALIGLASRLKMAKETLETEFEQARGNGITQKTRFVNAFHRVTDSLERDIRRLGSRINEIREKDFGSTVQKRMDAIRDHPGTFEVAEQLGQVNLEERVLALQPHLEKLKTNQADFTTRRNGFLDQVRQFVQPGLELAPGNYALRIHYIESPAPEFIIRGDVRVGRGDLQFAKPEDGSGEFASGVERLWRQMPSVRRRPLTAEERDRLNRYLAMFQEMNLITEPELKLYARHVASEKIEILDPVLEVHK